MSDSEKTGVKGGSAHVISPHSISVYANAAGHDKVTDEVITTLSSHVTEMLRDILKECKIQMNVYRQSSLSTDILSNVFQTYGIPQMLGNKVHIPFVPVPNSDISMLHLPKLDLVAEAAAESVAVDLEPVPFVIGLYVSPALASGIEFNVGNEAIEPKSHLDGPDSSHNKLSTNRRCTLTTEETNYFLVVTQIILKASENMFKIILEDLRSNPRIRGVYCALLNFVGNSIRDFNCVGQLTKRLLKTVNALLDNPYFDPSSTLSASQAIHSLCTLIGGSNIANDCDDFPYRGQASHVLMRALNTWNIDAKERIIIISRLTSTLESPEKMSLKSNYSTLMMFHGLGYDVLDSYFWPYLEKYLNVLSSLDEVISGKRSISLTTDICHVKSTLLLLVAVLYRNFWAPNQSERLLHLEIDTLLHEYFGEAIAYIRPYAVPKPSLPLFVYSTSRSSPEELVDVRKNYKKMKAMPIRRKYPTVNVPKVNARTRHYINDVFVGHRPCHRNTAVVFNFDGSNQRNSDQLRMNEPDRRYNFQYIPSVHARKSYPQFEKPTRCIKYCKTKLSFVGDIFQCL